MKFIAHSHYNNNSDGLGKFNSPDQYMLLGENSVNITDRGFTILLLRKYLTVEQKLEFLKNLHHNLMRSEGHGLDTATCADSDCVLRHELDAYYSGVKQIDSKIKTVWVGDPEDQTRSGFKTDFVINWRDTHKRLIVDIVDAQAKDKIKPSRGWAAYQTKIERIYNESLLAAVPECARDRDLRWRLGISHLKL